MTDNNLRYTISRWLSPPDPHVNHEFNSTARRGQETGNWFLHSPEFIAWKTGFESNFLWLYGIRKHPVVCYDIMILT